MHLPASFPFHFRVGFISGYSRKITNEKKKSFRVKLIHTLNEC